MTIEQGPDVPKRVRHLVKACCRIGSENKNMVVTECKSTLAPAVWFRKLAEPRLAVVGQSVA